MRALDAFVADAHRDRRCVQDGVLPARVLDTADNADAGASDLGPRRDGVPWVGVAGLDVVRDDGGAFQVLEDNCRAPSGLAYALVARDALRRAHGPEALEDIRPLDAAPAMLARALAAVRPDRTREARTVVLTDGPHNAAHDEHRRLAAAVGADLLTPADVEVREDRLVDARGATVDVVYRRTDDDLTDTPVGRLLAPALRAGTLGIVNAFGTGIADDKLVHAYVEDLVRYYIGDEPLLRSVRSYDLEVDDVREEALDRLGELVVKPRGGQGGAGVRICPELEDDEVDALRREIEDAPERYVAQELVRLSREPTVVDGEIRPRHVDLRPFVLVGEDGPEVVPGGLTRVALKEGSMMVNSSQDGGAKDTWVRAA